VTILDVSHRRLQYLDDVFGGRVRTLASNEANVRETLRTADLVIGGVLIPGARAPHLVTKDMLSTMPEGSVIVDVAVDQGGCVETIHATTHDDPTYVVDGVVHYGVANMPGAVPRTSTFALTNQTIGYALKLADHGLEALKGDKALLKGLNRAWRTRSRRRLLNRSRRSAETLKSNSRRQVNSCRLFGQSH
jgi:alanine dehydrogenase